MHSIDESTIVAQCTPKGTGALALIRLSGIDAISIANRIAKLSDGLTLINAETHTIHYGSVIDSNGNVIDRVLFLLMKAPKTFTGQDTVEITVHNNQFIIEQIIQSALQAGARLAQHGEFTRRAYENNKIDLLQAEAINELIHANNQLLLKQSLSQLQGSFSQWVHDLEQTLISCLALSEASFEFLDDEMEFGDQIKQHLIQILETIATVKKTFDQQKQIRQGIRIAIIGSVNAGKSQLFNALLQQNRSIVTNIAGTTRDVIEAGLYRNQHYWTLIDTAGLRQADNIVEMEGIKRSHEEAIKADIILLVCDGSRTMTIQEQETYQQLHNQYQAKTIIVRNKIDLPQIDHTLVVDIAVSAETNQNITELLLILEQKIKQLFTTAESPFLLNARHYNLLLTLEHKIQAILAQLSGTIAYELLSVHIKEALECLTELTGKTITEQGMDAIFRQFCIGK